MASSDAAPGTGPSASEPNLAPVTLTPQRMQSIGVKTGVAEFRPVRDEIRTAHDLELKLLQLQLDEQMMLAAIERLIGGEL